MSLKRMEFGNKLFETIYGFSRLERAFCRTAGVYYGQPRILTVLSDHEGKTLSELSPICGIGLSSLCVSLRNLQKSNLVFKVGKGKSQRVYLTDTGKEKALRFHQEIEAYYAACLDHLGEEKSRQLFELLSQFSGFTAQYLEKYETNPSEEI